MFAGSYGLISRIMCSPDLASAELSTRRSKPRRALPPSPAPFRMITARVNRPRQAGPDRELIAKTSLSTSVTSAFNISAITKTVACAKCGTFKHSSRLSCCAPGGAWFKKCGVAVEAGVEYSWSEGVEVCKRTSTAKTCT